MIPRFTHTHTHTHASPRGGVSTVATQSKVPTGGRGRERREKGKRRKEGVPSYVRRMRPRTHQKRSGEGFPAMTKHPGTPKEEGRWRGKRERKKERKKER